MKKKLILPIVLCLCLSVFSQDDKSFRFGMQGSGNFGWLKPDPDAKSESEEPDGLKLGFSYGVMTDFILFDNDNYVFSTGLNILTNGGRLKYPDFRYGSDSIVEIGESNVRYNFRYIDFPLTLKMRTNEIGYLTYYGQFGFGTGINIKGIQNKRQNLKGVSEEIRPEPENIADRVQLFRMALIIGGGIEYNLSGNTSVVIGATFNNGFTNVFRKNEQRFAVDSNGEFDEAQIDGTEVIPAGGRRKAISNFMALHVGVFF